MKDEDYIHIWRVSIRIEGRQNVRITLFFSFHIALKTPIDLALYKPTFSRKSQNIFNVDFLRMKLQKAISRVDDRVILMPKDAAWFTSFLLFFISHNNIPLRFMQM